MTVVGKYVELTSSELLLLDESIAGDWGRRWEGCVEVVYDSPATAYTPAEVSERLGIPEAILDAHLAEHWIEHDIRKILDGTLTVRMRGEGLLLTPSLNERGPSLCRLFSPKPGTPPLTPK